jgi:hypothetical protein
VVTPNALAMSRASFASAPSLCWALQEPASGRRTHLSIWLRFASKLCLSLTHNTLAFEHFANFLVLAIKRTFRKAYLRYADNIGEFLAAFLDEHNRAFKCSNPKRP